MKREEQDRQKLFNRRSVVVAGLQGSLMAALFGRLYYLSVVESERYTMMAEENRIDMRLLSPIRGRILDRTGIVLAGNRQNYRVVLVPEQTARRRTRRRSEMVRHVEITLDKLAQLVPLSAYDRKRVLREVKRKRSFMPITVIENLSWEEFSRINVHAPDIPGVTPDVGDSRYYPSYDTFAHVAGYVAAVSETDLDNEQDPVLELPGFRIGKLGVEKVYEHQLRGVAGTSRVEVNAVGRVIREVQRENGQPGQDVVLTLDRDLQEYAKLRLGAESGAVVVMDTVTGEMIVSTSAPGYDPNEFVLGISHNSWNQLTSNKRDPLTNKAVTGRYPPGSTFKMVVALAGLEAGIIDPNEKVFCSGHMDLGSHRFHCWKRHGHGHMNLHEAISQSCDVYYYEMSQRIGIDRIAAMARRFGLGSAPDVPMSAVRAGIVPDKAWKRARTGEGWHRGETLNVSIGQGQVLTTPLQLAVMTARLANGVTAVNPVLVRSIGGVTVPNPNIDTPEMLDIPQRHMVRIQKAMSAVMNEPRGTARGSAIPEVEGGFAGKTGTAQVRRISRAERETGVRKNEEKAWEERDHALFVGYGPEVSPRYAIAVVVEHGGSGSKAAAPIASDVMREVLRRDPSADTTALASVLETEVNPASNDSETAAPTNLPVTED